MKPDCMITIKKITYNENPMRFRYKVPVLLYRHQTRYILVNNAMESI